MGKYKESTYLVYLRRPRQAGAGSWMWGSRQWEGTKQSDASLALRRVNGCPQTCKVHFFHTVILLQDSSPSCDSRTGQTATHGSTARMASFFDIKARKAAAANGAGKQEKKTSDTPRAQPWVEK